jgi:hypothetical protein
MASTSARLLRSPVRLVGGPVLHGAAHEEQAEKPPPALALSPPRAPEAEERLQPLPPPPLPCPSQARRAAARYDDGRRLRTQAQAQRAASG